MEQRTDRSGGPDACWPFIGCRNRSDYGQIRTGSKADGTAKAELAHRVAWELANGPIPDCCNPAHLFLGTAADNAADRDAKGRRRTRPLPGEANHQSRLSEQTVRDMRRQYADGGVSQRQLAREHGVSQARIQKIVSGEAWRHIE